MYVVRNIIIHKECTVTNNLFMHAIITQLMDMMYSIKHVANTANLNSYIKMSYGTAQRQRHTCTHFTRK